MAFTKGLFKKIASQELSLSDLMAGRKQVTTDEIIGKELTIMEFDFATITDKGVEKTFPVVVFNEMPDRYYNGGTLLAKICMAWAAEFDGDIEEASDALAQEGGVKVRFRNAKTKGGNNIVAMDVL